MSILKFENKIEAIKFLGHHLKIFNYSSDEGML